MSKADASNSKRSLSSTAARVRGTYVSEACVICRGKKIKCDGLKPVCERCTSSGRSDECSWGEGTIRKPRTEAHFEAMRKRADALREYANLLEAQLEKCRREHGGFSDNGQSYLQFRPKDADQMTLPEEVDGTYGEDVDPSHELCIPTQNLTLGDNGIIQVHGITAIFRFASSEPVDLQPSGSRFPAIAENPEETYVLMVDGASDAHFNPDFDWSRHLPKEVPLERKEHDKVLDLLFKFFTSWCLRVVPALFLRDMYRALSTPPSRTPPKTPHYSPMLHNALVALATAFSDDPRIRDLRSRQYFANTAKQLIESECQKPSLSAVHALSVLGSFHSSQGDQSLGYMYFGMSARISQILGLSIDCSAWVKSGLITEHDRLDRNWAHWTTFCQDVCWSLYVGREFCVPLSFNTSHIPVPFVDSHFDQMEWQYGSVPAQPNFLSKTFAASCELLMIARRIMDVVNGLNSGNSRNAINDTLISDIDLQLNTWKSNLSPDVDITAKSKSTATPHRLMVHLAYWWLFILLHRPFYNRRARPVHSSDREIDHVKLCKRAAESLVELLNTWRDLYTMRYAPITLIQTVFSAGTVFLLTAVQATTGVRVAQKELKHGLDQTKLCTQFLHEIGKSWQCARNIAGILENLLQQQLKPLLERRTISISVIHDGQQPVQVKRTPSSRDRSRLRSGPTRGVQKSPSQRRGRKRLNSPLITATSDAPEESSTIEHHRLGSADPQASSSSLLPPLSPWSLDDGYTISPPASSSISPTSAEPSISFQGSSQQFQDPDVFDFDFSPQESSTDLPSVGYDTSNSTYQVPAEDNYSGMECSGYLAMPEGESLPITPFMPLLSMGEGGTTMHTITSWDCSQWPLEQWAMDLDQGVTANGTYMTGTFDEDFVEVKFSGREVESTASLSQSPETSTFTNGVHMVSPPERRVHSEHGNAQALNDKEAWMKFYL